jgi:hypothetical protein
MVRKSLNVQLLIEFQKRIKTEFEMLVKVVFVAIVLIVCANANWIPPGKNLNMNFYKNFNSIKTEKKDEYSKR